MAELSPRIARLLREAREPLTTAEIAAALDVQIEDVDETIWGDTDLFHWQPGHRWVVVEERKAPLIHDPVPTQDDARQGPLAPKSPVALRAITLSSGAKLKVLKRPMDSESLFVVRPVGSNIELVLNSAHDAFDYLPIPFEDEPQTDGFQMLLEMMLEAWALFEDGVAGTSAKRAAEDARMLWGRRLGELVRSSHARS